MKPTSNEPQQIKRNYLTGPIISLNKKLSSSQICLNESKKEDYLKIGKYVNDLKRKSQPDLLSATACNQLNLSTSMYNITNAESSPNLAESDGFDMKKFSIINKSQLINGDYFGITFSRVHILCGVDKLVRIPFCNI